MKWRLCVLLFCLAACATPQVQLHNSPTQAPQLLKDVLVTSDGSRLPLQVWVPSRHPRAVIIALHGMNDYSHAFALPGGYLSKQGFAVFAYDQRGFGASPSSGIWPGEENLVSDLRDMISAVKQRHPKTPVFVLGVSMGGAVAITAFSQPDFPAVDGLILAAPAVWGGQAMNPFYRASLWSLAHIVPGRKLTGEGLHIMATDNIEVLREMWHDPLVQKGTRVDSVLGLVRLMDKAYANLRTLKVPVLVLYGKNDQVIPPWALAGALDESSQLLAYYPGAYHMLLRDLHRDIPYADVVSWISSPGADLPSGRARPASAWLSTLQQAPAAKAFSAAPQRIAK